MPPINVNLWLLFIPFFIIFIVTALWMKNIAQSFYTSIPVKRRFSIFSLEFPGSDDALTKLIARMDNDVKKQVKKHLLIDYLFMFGVYAGIAILCFIAARNVYKDSPFGSSILYVLGMFQIVAWLCDAIENRILLQKLSSPRSTGVYPFYKWIVAIKFFLAFTAFTSTLSAMIYLWLIGGFSARVTLLISAVLILFILWRLFKAVDAHYKRLKKEQLIMQTAEAM